MRWQLGLAGLLATLVLWCGCDSGDGGSSSGNGAPPTYDATGLWSMRITGETVIDNPSGMLKPTDRGLVHALDLKQSKSGKISGTLSGVNQDGDLFEGKVKGSVCEADCSFKSTLIMMATGKKDCDITGSFALSNETTGRGNFTYQQFSGSYLGAGQEDFTLSKM